MQHKDRIFIPFRLGSTPPFTRLNLVRDLLTVVNSRFDPVKLDIIYVLFG